MLPFRVELANGQTVDSPATTKDLACRAAEASTGSKAVACHLTERIRGHCGLCGQYLFESENHQTRHGDLRCEACG